MISFYPPKVDYKRPKLATVIAFLKSKKWTIDKKTDRFIIVKPPEETRTMEEGGYRYHLPHSEEVYSYDQAAFIMVETFSEIFEIPLQELFDLLSKSLDEIREHVARNPQQVKMQKAMLACAS